MGSFSTSSAAPRTAGPQVAEARDRILEAGTRLLADRGLDAINTNVIARAAGVGVGTFYSQFEDKHAFHRAVVARGLELASVVQDDTPHVVDVREAMRALDDLGQVPIGLLVLALLVVLAPERDGLF